MISWPEINAWTRPRCLFLHLCLALGCLAFLLGAGGGEETLVPCHLLGLFVGLGALLGFGLFSLPYGLHWQRCLRMLWLAAGIFAYFGFASVLPIVLVQMLVCLAASSFSMAVGSVLLRQCKLAPLSSYSERLSLLASIVCWSLAYLVLMLHREVNGQFAGLSARLSREEHLVLFSFGAFLISTVTWFFLLLLPCGRRALQGKKLEVREESVSRYPSKEEAEEETLKDTVVEITEVLEDFGQDACDPAEPQEDFSVMAADLPGEVSDEEKEDKPVAKPLIRAAAPFPFPRGPSRPRRREEAWGPPQGLSAVPEGDEDTEGEPEEVARCNVRSFLAKAAPALAPSAAAVPRLETWVAPAGEELLLEDEAVTEDEAVEACPSDDLLDPPRGPRDEPEDLGGSAERTHRRGPEASGAEMSLDQVGRAAVVSLAAHTCAGLILLLGGYIIVVMLAVLSVKLFFLIAVWLDSARLPDPKIQEEISVLTPLSTASSPTGSPLAKVPEAYVASWGFFPPDGPDGSGADRFRAMPPVLEEDVREEPGASPPCLEGDATDAGADVLRASARQVTRPGGARPGRRRPEREPEELSDIPQHLSVHFPFPPGNEILTSTDSEHGEVLSMSESVKVQKVQKVPRMQNVGSRAAAVCTPLALLLIAVLHAFVLFFVFTFDLVFIEKYAASSLSRHFILGAVNATCVDSQRLSTLGAFTRPSACAREVLRTTSHTAFSMGPVVEGSRGCYPQLGIEPASFAEIFYGESSQGFCPWMTSPGFDLFVIEKHQACSILGRGTSLIVGNATALSHQVSDDLEAAMPQCSACSRVVQSILTVSRGLLHADVLLHQLLSTATVGLHRLGAAACALGAALAALLLLLFDACSLLALGREALALRVGVPLVRYATANFLGEVLEQFILLLLHCVLMAGAAFQLELANDFWPELHCTRKQSAGGDHNVWHQPVQWTGTVLVFFAASASFILAAFLLGGFTYSFNTLPRWSVSTACPRDVQLSHFARCGECRHEILAVDPAPLSSKSLLRPLLGALASLGIWHHSTSAAFQVVERQDWYLPAMPETTTSVFPSDCVSWRSMARATVHGLSISWLLLPYGGLPARACLYLNECILLTHGTDGGSSADEPNELSHHALEDNGPILHVARWAAAIGHLVNLLLLLAVDFFDLTAAKREKLIQDLLVAGAVLSLLRSSLTVIDSVQRYLRRRDLVVACCCLVQESLPARVVQSHVRAQQKTLPRSRSEEEADALGIQPWRAGPLFGKGSQRARLPLRSLPEEEEDLLSGLSVSERERVVFACRDLLQLPWVRSSALPGRLRAKLSGARSSRSGRVRLAEALRGKAVPRGWLSGALLLALREVAEEDLCMQSCSSEAKQVVSKYLRQHCTMQAVKLQLWLQDHAKSQIARWAAALWTSGAVGDILQATAPEEALERVEESWGVKSAESDREAEEARSSKTETRESNGFGAGLRCAMRSLPWRAGDAPQSLRMLFAVTQHGLVRVSGHWAAGGREILPEQQASVNITAQAEVVLYWPRSGVSSSDVQVEFISHQIWPPLPPMPESGSRIVKRNERQRSTRRRLGTAWTQRKELQWERWPGCGKTCTALEEDHMDSLWRIQCSVEWGEHPAECDSDKFDGTKLFTELGCLLWAAPVALPALPALSRPVDDLGLKALRGRCLGARVAALVSGGAVGLGPASTVPQDVTEELSQAAASAAWTAAAAAAQAPKVAMQMLEVALSRNPRQLSASFSAALYAGTGGLSQVEARRRSWLTAAAARKMRYQARLQSTLAGKANSFWTCRERKRWLRSSERARMGLTFLGNLAQEEEGDAMEDGVIPYDASPDRRSSRHSEGTSSDQVRPFSRPPTPPVIITEVDGPEDFDAIPGRRLDAPPAQDSRWARALEARQGADIEQGFEQQALERAALGLLEAVQSGSIRQLSSRLSMARELGLDSAAFPDAAGMGVVQLAAEKLEEEKAAVPLRLAAALQAFKKGHHGRVGVIALQRCIDQARAAEIQDHVKIYKVEAKLHLLCERKREIALLKAAMAVEDAWLLKAATEECRQRFGDSFGVDLSLAKSQLEIWEEEATQVRASCSRDDGLAPSLEEKAQAALRAVMFHEPLQAELLRLAIARARRAGVEVEHAEQLLQEEREVEQSLEQLRRASAARDVRALRRAIADCTDVGVDQRLLMPAATQLVEALGELTVVAQQHGLAVESLEREREELRVALEQQSGLRSICRVRPPLAQELQEALRMNEGLTPVLRRVDGRTLEVALEGRFFSCAFSAVLGPESTQSEVYGELTGLAQAALEGRDVSIVVCGPPGAGTSFTLCGTSEQPGVLPQLLEEVFALRAREQWRSEIHVDVQALEVDELPSDLLTPKPSPIRVAQGPGTLLEGAATRRVAKVQELKDLVEEIWRRPCRSERPALLILYMRRTNRHTGVTICSRLLVADAGRRADRAASAIATSVALRRKGGTTSTWSPTAEAAPGDSQVLTKLLQDCFNVDRGLIALVICLPPTARDREKVLMVLEVLGLQRWAQAAETRAKRFQPPQPLELTTPNLPSPVLLQQMASLR